VADADVTRPTLYRRWKNKLDLVVDALDYGQDCCMSASKALNTNPLAIRAGLGGE
jgi:AcrR family transcriptional regulator